MYDRRNGERTLTFDFGEGLVEDNLLVVDRETSSIWSQLDGKAISGPLAGHPMRVVPTLQTTWGHWRRLHPDTLVLTVPGTEGRPYRYRQDRGPLGLGLSLGGKSLFAPIKVLAKRARKNPGHSSPSLSLHLGDRSIRLFVEPNVPTAWVEDEQGHLLPGVLAYRPGWLAFHPDSEILGSSGTPARVPDDEEN